MFSRLRLALSFTAAVGALFILTSCNFHFRESPESEKAMQLGSSESGCLTGSYDTISNFLSGTASDHEINAVWSCLSRSLQLFSERTRGAEPGIYKPDELRKFLQKYFLTNFQISDGLLREAMELKCTLLGGSPDLLTLEEIGRTRQLLQVLTEQSIRIKTFIPMSFAWVAKKDARTVDEAVNALEAAAQAIGRPLQKTGYPYHFSRFNALRKEIEELRGRSTSSAIFKSFRDRMPLASALKSILVSPKGDRIDGHEWVNFLTTSARWYGVALRLKHLQLNYKDWTTGEGRKRFTNVLIDALTLLDEAIARHPGEVIPFSELDLLIDGLDDSELPLADRAQGSETPLRPALKKLIRPLVQRAIGGTAEGRDGRAAQGLTRTGLKRIVNMVEQWSEGQRFIEALFERARLEHGESSQGYAAEDLLKFSNDAVLGPGEIGPVMLEAADSIRRFLPKSPAFFKPGDSFISVSTPPATERSYHDVSVMNLSYVAARVLLQGYAAIDRAKSETGITLEEFHDVLADVLDVGLALRILDPNRDNKQMFATRFMEGSLFTYVSNGDRHLDVHETAQLFPMLFSAYLMAKKIHITAETDGCPVVRPDPFGKQTYNTSCYLDSYFRNTPVYWERLPGMLRYYQSLDSRQKKDFEANLVRAARLPGSPRHFINSNDSIGFAGVVQYVDAMFSRFDKDASGTLNAQEAKAAFPVFRAALKKVVEAKGQSKLIGDDDLEALFTYILAHSGAPAGLWDLPGWWIWKSKSTWEFETDRLGILKIFAQLMN